MTTAANAINSFLEVGTITPGYAAVRAHRPLQGRLGSRKALLASTVLAGAFGLMAVEAIAQQYNLPGSGGFTDVSSSINVVTDAGGGNIRVVLADGVQFFAGPGQYQLNPMSSSLQVSTDVLLNAYTGAAPIAAQQTQQAFSAAQAQSYAAPAPFNPTPVVPTPAVYPANAPLTLGANQYATQPSVVGGYQMQPSVASYGQTMPAYATSSAQYVPAYSSGIAGYGQSPVPSYASFSGAGTASSTFGGMQPSSVTSAFPTNQVAMAPAIPAAAAAAGGMFGIPTWALVGGGVAAGGAALLAAGSLSGSDTTSSGSTNSLSVTEQQYLNDPAVQAALGNTNSGSQASSDDDDDDSSSDSSSSSSTSSGGITVSGGSSGSSSSSDDDDDDSGSAYTVPAGSSGQTITGSSSDDTVTFADGGNVENIASLDLKAGDGDRVILKDVDEDLDIPDLQNVENLDIELSADGLDIDLQDVGSEVANVMIDADNSHDFTVNNADAVDMITVKDAGNETATIEDMADQSTIALEDSEDVDVTMKSGSDNELTVSVSAVTNADISLDTNVDDLTITSVGSSPNVIANITATSATTLELTGTQDLEIEEEIGAGGLAAVTTVSGAAADGELTLTLNGATIETVTLGDGGDNLTIDVTDTDAEISTGDGNDDVTINNKVTSGTVDTGAGADDIVLNGAALVAGDKIDGGAGSNDEITLNASVTAGTITNVETINIGSVSVNLDRITGETDVNVLASDTAIIDNLGTEEVDVGSGASVAILDATGTTLTFDASGSMTLDIDDAAVTALTVDLGSGATLTFDQDVDTTVNAVPSLTQMTLTSSGNVTLAEDDAGAALTASGVSKLDVSGVSGDFGTTNLNSAANAFDGLSEFKGAQGADTINVTNSQGTFTLNAGNDTIVFTAMTAGVDVYGGAGRDTVTLQAGGTIADDVYFTSSADFAVTVQTGAATAIGTYDLVQNFETTHDEIDLTALTLSGDQTVGTGQVTIAAAITDMTDGTNSSVELVDAAVDGAGINYLVVNLDGTNFGVIDLNNVTVVGGDIEI